MPSQIESDSRGNDELEFIVFLELVERPYTAKTNYVAIFQFSFFTAIL